ncbi:MAG TPA: hypothetical protein DCS66_20830 [Flavobacteriaceae bacterium]|jgi:hypothetical protein|nr:hypothetical protein [Flavobacteriaceae bacterium]|tara:strand:- start:3898 stop:4449 length:552 start_codon:yes stop_codon:yes gene_type:complete
MNNIFIQDNFFEDEIFNTIKNEIDTVEFTPPSTETRKYQSTYWFDHKLPMGCDVQRLIYKKIKFYFNEEVDFDSVNDTDCIYTMSNAKDHPRPHRDLMSDIPTHLQYQCLIYIKGDSHLANGTGFYTRDLKDKLKFHLHLNVGFKENRAVFFSSDNWHSPMQWSGESSWRYSIANFMTMKGKK